MLNKPTMNNIKNYNGYKIELAENSHCAIIYKGNSIIKCIAGDILPDGTNDREKKAVEYIDSIN